MGFYFYCLFIELLSVGRCNSKFRGLKWRQNWGFFYVYLAIFGDIFLNRWRQNWRFSSLQFGDFVRLLSYRWRHRVPPIWSPSNHLGIIFIHGLILFFSVRSAKFEREKIQVVNFILCYKKCIIFCKLFTNLSLYLFICYIIINFV